MTVDTVEERTLTRNGPVKGYTIKAEQGDMRVFLGIPYGEAPEGDMRFEVALPRQPWSQTIDCTAFGPNAIPPVRLRRPRLVSEDCLRVNVMCPARRRAGGHPVLFVSYPSAFCTGSADCMSPDLLVRQFVQRGFVVVSYNFRIGPFGFASTGDEAMPGNLGLHDAVLAFDWTRDNIDAFGGDPHNITAWGFSAGSMGSSLLGLMPGTRRHVRRVVCSSGSALGGFAFGEGVVDATRRLARALGLDADADSRALKAALKRRSVDQFYAAVQTAGAANHSLPFKWVPRIDGHLIPKDLPELIADAPKMPVMCGWTTDEALFFYHNFLKGNHGVAIPEGRYRTMNHQELVDRIRNVHITEQYFGDLAPKIQDDIVNFYASDAENLTDPVACLDREIKMVSHLYCTVPNYVESLLRTQNGHKVFLYQNSHWEEHHFSEKHPHLRGCMHVAEAKLLYGWSVPSEYENSAADNMVRDTYVNSVINFVKNDDPSHDQLAWPAMSLQRPWTNLHLCAQPHVREHMGAEQKHFNFWLGMSQKHGQDAVRTALRAKRAAAAAQPRQAQMAARFAALGLLFGLTQSA